MSTSDKRLQGQLPTNLVPEYVDFGRNPYHDDGVDIYDVFTDMLITPEQHIQGPNGAEKEDMTLTATCTLWRHGVEDAPPQPCGPVHYVGPVGFYPSSDEDDSDNREWKDTENNPNIRKRMRDTARKEKGGLGGSICNVPLLYHIKAERLDQNGDPSPESTPEFEKLWRSLLKIDKDGQITMSSRQKDICDSESLDMKPLLRNGLELTVTPYLTKPYSPPDDYNLSTRRALDPINFKVSWTWISYNPTMMTAILGQRPDQKDCYRMCPFVSPSLRKYRDEKITKAIEEDRQKREKKREKRKREMQGKEKKKGEETAEKISTYFWMSGYACGYNLKYTIAPDDGVSWPHPVTVDNETGVVNVSAPEAKGHTTNTKAKGKLTVDVDMQSGTNQMLNAGMGFPKTFPIEIEWMSPTQWYKGVYDAAARATGNVADYSTTKGLKSKGNGDNLNFGGCAKPQVPNGDMSPDVAKKFNELGKPSCYTANAQYAVNAGVGPAQAGGGGSVTVAAGCEQLVAQMSTYNSFNQALSCQLNAVKQESNTFMSMYSRLNIEIGGDLTGKDGSSIDFSNKQSQKLKFNASLRSVNQQSLTAITANVIKSTASSKIKWANGSGAVPHGSKSIKQLTQNANQITNSQNINTITQTTFAGMYMDGEVNLKIDGSVYLEGSDLTLNSAQQQEALIANFVGQTMGSVTGSVMDNHVTDRLTSDVVDESKGVFEGLAGFIRAQQTGTYIVAIVIIVLALFGLIGGVMMYKKKNNGELIKGKV